MAITTRQIIARCKEWGLDSSCDEDMDCAYEPLFRENDGEDVESEDKDTENGALEF